MTGRWYRSGDALALVTGVGVVVTDPGQEATLAALFEQPLTVPGLVEALTARGWSSVPDFACTLVEGDEVRVLVRGRHRVEIGDELLEGHGVTTWSERSWPRAEVDTVVLHAGDSGGAEPSDAVRLPIDAGLVRASQVRWVLRSRPEAGAAAPAALSTAALSTAADPVPAADPVAAEPPAPDSPATIIEPDEHEFDAMFGVTVPGRRPEDAAVRPVEADLDEGPEDPAEEDPTTPEAVMTPGSGDHDGHTVARASLPRRGAAARTVSHRPGPLVTLTLSTGETYDVSGRALVGRSPRSTAVTGAALPQLVVVDDPYVSSTHLEIAVAAATVLVTDVSTNGTTLTPPGGTEGVLVRDVPTDAADGSVLRLSDDLTITLALSGGAP
ncbi:FHA domain-containing protein [Aeromicrobium sp.]|uniref:FHA domain-containing protein n=1 Tax=Aeromicrobium sp. TaxID=1871063 RepID=UPI0025C412BC|nr:FHA domain-containing protein [Aeromicrobium sp.]MCK5891297.1 FHA domain-containing protein [Aeromicrobium sp.]